MLEMYVARVGTVCVDTRLTIPGVRDGDRVHTPVLICILILPSGEAVIIDSGMHDGHVEDPGSTWRATDLERELVPVMTTGDRIGAQLSILGLRPRDITFIINTHLHFDHAGNNLMFPQARYLVQQEHLDWAKGNPACPNQYWADEGRHYEGLSGAVDLWEGVSVIPTPGHVPGHQSVSVRLGREQVLVCGDAIYSHEAMELEAWSAHAEPAQARESGYALRHIAYDRGARLLYGHDPVQVRRMPLVPRQVMWPDVRDW